MRRKQYLPWLAAVLGIFGTSYGTHLLIYHYVHGNGLSVLALILLIAGILSLSGFIVLSVSIAVHRKKKVQKEESIPEIKKEEVIIEAKEEVKPVTPTRVEEPKKEVKEYTPRKINRSMYDSDNDYYSTIYVKKVGYGPLLRIEGNRILDMRSNTYYRIENNIVMQEGYGILYEIRGNQIRDAFGGYLYELSGSNINKVFGGFFASISGNYITIYDLSDKFETTGSLNKKQILVTAVLLFGRY